MRALLLAGLLITLGLLIQATDHTAPPADTPSHVHPAKVAPAAPVVEPPVPVWRG